MHKTNPDNWGKIKNLRTSTFANFFLPTVFIAILSLISLSSCKKESSIAGLNVLPKNDLLNVLYSDTTSLVSYSQKVDSLETSNTPYNLLGNYNDPIFGTTSASIYTQFNTIGAVDFGTDLVLDSAVLILPYEDSSRYYGSLSPITVNVYELNENISDTNYSTKVLAIKPSVVGSITFTPEPIDSVIVGTSKLVPHVRIKLDSIFASNIVKQGGFTDNGVFQNFFKGLFISSVGEGALLYLNLTHLSAGISMYYRKNVNDTSSGDPMNVLFSINNNNSNRFTHFDHDYSNADSKLKDQINGNDLTQGKNVVYVQSTGGVKTKIKMPYIKNWKNKPIIINKAELILKIDPVNNGGISSSAIPNKQLIIFRDSLGKQYLLPDLITESSYFGGKYDAIKQQYTFNISRYIQQIIADKVLNNYDLDLVSVGSAVNGERVVLGGSENPNYKMKLNISYTKVN